MPRIELRQRKSPRQQRSADTVEALLTAAARVLERESLAGFNTNRVAEVAGVSVGSLYQYFPNKSALIAALIDRYGTFANMVRAGIDKASEVGDADSADILTGVSRAMDKALWFLEAHAPVAA